MNDAVRDAIAARLEDLDAPLEPVSDEDARRAWSSLSSGGWSLLDHFDRDGRRYLVVVRSEAPSTRRLSRREREVCDLAVRGESNKVIAGALGIALSTVAGHLGASMRKLRVSSRVELIARWSLLRQLAPARKSALAHSRGPRTFVGSTSSFSIAR
jgi:DNA-binding NarL/FixJ family response regulator